MNSKFRELSQDERIRLVEGLWDSIAEYQQPLRALRLTLSAEEPHCNLGHL